MLKVNLITYSAILVIVLLAFGYVAYNEYYDDDLRADRMCSSLKYVNDTHTMFFPALDSDLMVMMTEGNIRIDEIDYVGVDQIVDKFGQFVARCDYHVRKCRLFDAVYSGLTNSTDFLCSDLNILVGVKESEVESWLSSLV